MIEKVEFTMTTEQQEVAREYIQALKGTHVIIPRHIYRLVKNGVLMLSCDSKWTDVLMWLSCHQLQSTYILLTEKS